MPQSLSVVYLHLVFSTKDRRPFLRDKTVREEMHARPEQPVRYDEGVTGVDGFTAEFEGDERIGAATQPRHYTPALRLPEQVRDERAGCTENAGGVVDCKDCTLLVVQLCDEFGGLDSKGFHNEIMIIILVG